VFQKKPGGAASGFFNDASVEEIQPEKAKHDYTLSLGNSFVMMNKWFPL